MIKPVDQMPGPTRCLVDPASWEVAKRFPLSNAERSLSSYLISQIDESVVTRFGTDPFIANFWTLP